ncbi:MAG TPA: GNAT family N-acetyltransferase [Anaerolineales bacterium]|nr:GNAT family N-acetyltransferase [Anaerolineales bacterium]
MSFTFRPLDEISAQTILNWQYDAPYDIYNLGSSDLESTAQYLLDPQNNFFGIYDQEGNLEGFCSFGPDGQVNGGDYSMPALDIGLGVRPDLTGQGRGFQYASAVIDFAIRTYSPERLRVTIAAFNKRAMRVWEKAGFYVMQKFQGGWTNMDFVVMMKTMS